MGGEVIFCLPGPDRDAMIVSPVNSGHYQELRHISSRQVHWAAIVEHTILTTKDIRGGSVMDH